MVNILTVLEVVQRCALEYVLKFVLVCFIIRIIMALIIVIIISIMIIIRITRLEKKYAGSFGVILYVVSVCCALSSSVSAPITLIIFIDIIHWQS